MKLSTTLALTGCAAVGAFLLGHKSHEETQSVANAPVAGPPAEASRGALPSRTRETGESAVRALGKYAASSREVTAENAAKLSSRERLELLEKGALAGDFGNQEAMLCGLISVLTREEIREAADTLGRIQDQGNVQAPEVWQGIWRQWGRVDPKVCLSFFGQDAVSKTTVDARNVMAGWLEVDSGGALAWAKEPGKSYLTAAAAALAISRVANGNLKELQAEIAALPAGESTAMICLEDYFDLASLSSDGKSVETVYDEMPSALKATAWTAAAKRIGYVDSAKAKAWLSAHASDSGRNYAGLSDLFRTLAYEDAEGTAQWAAGLPYSRETDSIHPIEFVMSRWRGEDPDAAEVWLKNQPQNAPWRSGSPQ